MSTRMERHDRLDIEVHFLVFRYLTEVKLRLPTSLLISGTLYTRCLNLAITSKSLGAWTEKRALCLIGSRSS